MDFLREQQNYRKKRWKTEGIFIKMPKWGWSCKNKEVHHGEIKRIWNGTAGMWTWCCGNGWQKDKRESHSFESGHGCIADGRTEWTSVCLSDRDRSTYLRT